MADVLVIDGHPDAQSLCAALAQRHAEGLRDGGATVEVLALRESAFDPILRVGYRERQPLEPDLQLGVGVDDALMRYVRAAIDAARQA